LGLPLSILVSGVTNPADFDGDGHVNQADMTIFDHCFTGPQVLYNPQSLPPGCSLTPDGNGKIPADFDRDGDVDHDDFGSFQRFLGS
jgi:hypothetical protein